MIINSYGYVARTKARLGRDWWLVKYQYSVPSNIGYVDLGLVTIPAKFVGKKVRFKMEVIEE